MRSITVHELKAVLGAGRGVVVDVREPEEYAEGHVPGARPVPLQTVAHAGGRAADRPAGLPGLRGGRPQRAGGRRSWPSTGVDAVNVDGGTGEWAAAGYPSSADPGLVGPARIATSATPGDPRV